MHDNDLGGDDIKYVSYSILFTRPDFEATLQEEREEVVDYATTEGAFLALKVANYTSHFGTARPLPESWKGDPPYPTDAYGIVGDAYTTIPENDRKYITPVMHVKRRLDKNQAQYDKDKVQALNRIARNTDRI